MIPLLGAFAAGFIVIFPGLCLLSVSLDRKEEKARIKNKRKGNDDEDDKVADGRLASIQANREETPLVDVAKGEKNWRDDALVACALFLLVFGAFMLGIIVTNSFMNLNPKPPLCV